MARNTDLEHSPSSHPPPILKRQALASAQVVKAHPAKVAAMSQRGTPAAPAVSRRARRGSPDYGAVLDTELH